MFRSRISVHSGARASKAHGKTTFIRIDEPMINIFQRG